MENLSRPLSPSLGGTGFRPSDRLLGKLGMVAVPPVGGGSPASASSDSSTSSSSSASTSSDSEEERRKRKRERKKKSGKHKRETKHKKHKKHKKKRKRERKDKRTKDRKKRKKRKRSHATDSTEANGVAKEQTGAVPESGANCGKGGRDRGGVSAEEEEEMGDRHRLTWEARKKEREAQKAWRKAETDRLEELAPKPERGSLQARMDQRFQHRSFARDGCAEMQDNDIYGDGGFF
jgi:hypothetical protein